MNSAEIKKKEKIMKDKVQLLPIDNVDLEKLHKWHNDKEIKYPLMKFRFPIHLDSVKKWVADIGSENKNQKAVYGVFFNGVAIGAGWLCYIDYINKKCSVGAFIGETKYHNKGIGKIVFSLLLDFAFNGLGMNKVELEVLCSNSNAIHLYKKIGFFHEGTKREAYFANGKFLDIEIMSILKKEFFLNINLATESLVKQY